MVEEDNLENVDYSAWATPAVPVADRWNCMSLWGLQLRLYLKPLEVQRHPLPIKSRKVFPRGIRKRAFISGTDYHVT